VSVITGKVFATRALTARCPLGRPLRLGCLDHAVPGLFVCVASCGRVADESTPGSSARTQVDKPVDDSHQASAPQNIANGHRNEAREEARPGQCGNVDVNKSPHLWWRPRFYKEPEWDKVHICHGVLESGCYKGYRENNRKDLVARRARSIGELNRQTRTLQRTPRNSA
jgi:hypothetical protein